MAQFIEKTPNGLETWVNDDHEPGLSVHYRQDVEPLLQHCADMRNYGLADNAPSKKCDFYLYASLDAVALYDMLNRFGVDAQNQNHRKKFFKLLNTEFKKFKTTDKVHVPK